MKYSKYLLFIFGIFLIANVYSLGCCFDSSMGICSPNSLEESCSGENSQFYNDASCSSVSECNYGCCSIGLEKRYTIESTCYFLAQAQGLEHTWGISTQEQCATSSGGDETGACIIKGKYDSTCLFTAKKNCQGTFYQDTLCSNPSLNTTCEKTSQTTCYNGDVYYKDSCGNSDAQKENCDYDSGSICELNDNNEAFCKDLNCVDKFGTARTNGDSWCIGLDGEVLIADVRSAIFKKPNEKEPSFADSVGSRFFKQSCLNGEVITEPCADYRNEVCIPSNGSGSAQCVSNPAEECIMATPDEENPDDESWKDDCNSEWCYISRLDDCIQFAGETEVICGERRENWRELPQAQAGTDLAEVSSPLLADLGLVMCLPKISTGSDISSESFIPGEDGVCSLGDYEAITNFKLSSNHRHPSITGISKIRLNDWRAYSEDEDTYGNIGLVSLSEEHWGIGDYDNIYCLEGNPLFSEGSEKLSWSKFSTWVDIIIASAASAPCYGISGPAAPYVGAACTAFALSTMYKYEVDWGLPPTVRVEYTDCGKIKETKELSVDGKVVELLNARTVGLGDCAGDKNWAEKEGSSSNEGEKLFCKASDDGKECKYTYTSKTWMPPASGDCSLCGKDGLPCSEYRCKALGKSCEYFAPRDGAEKSYCVSSNDNSPPSISHSISPQSPVPPFSSIQINISTSEASYCKFNLGNAGNSFEGMKYELDGIYSTQHSVLLHVPGKKTINDSDASEYSLITDDGKYEMFVRCEDVAGNFNLAAYKIGFEVMQTPDSVPPAILNFTPKTGSAIKFNTTEKEVKFKLNEPAECRWDLENKPYEEMGTIDVVTEDNETYETNLNQFSCDTDISDFSLINGYYCSGVLKNVTSNITQTTTYYIRCKDQPWLEGKEDEYYSRNTNQNSFSYTLRPSKKLEITEVSPSGELTLSPGTENITLTVRTKDGGYSDKAICKWRIKYQNETTILYPFANTNSNKHTQIITNKTEGDYIIEVVCTDEAENIANETKTLKLRYDRTPAMISRFYNNKGTIKITTEEPAICKYVNKLDFAMGCTFSVDDNKSISMNSNKLVHSMKLTKGLTYYIKCKDNYGNQNSACDIIGKMV